MRLKAFLALSLAISACSSVASKPPKLVTCVLDPPSAALDCFDPAENKRYPLDISFAAQYTCFPLESMQELMTWISLVSK